MKQIKFICETCQHINSGRHSRGDYKVKDEFDSMTEAWEHIYHSYKRDDSATCNMIAIIIEEEK